jgi:hypothetical protein
MRDDRRQQPTAELQTGVAIHLNQPRLKVLIDHDIIPQDLKAMQTAVLINPRGCRTNCVRHQIPDLRVYSSLKVQLKMLVEIPGKLAKAQLVSGLMLSIVIRMFLDRVVGQVDIAIA